MKNARSKVVLRVGMPKVMPARPDIPNRCKALVEIVPADALGHPVPHGALFGIHDEFRHGTVHPGLVPSRRMPDVIRTRMKHCRQGCRTFVSGLRVEGLGPAKGVRRPPRHPVVPRHLPDHEVHQADLRRARHGRPGFHRHRRQVVAIDRGRPAPDHLRVGQRRQRLGIELRHRGRDARRRVRPAKHEGRAQNRLVPAAEGPHGPKHGFVPDKRRIPVAVPGHHGMGIQKALAKEDIAHVDHVFGVLRARGHPHERLVRMDHRRIGDVKMPVADGQVHRLHDMMRRAVKRGQHMRQPVEIPKILHQRPAALVVQIPDERRPRHRYEDRMRPAEGQVIGRVPGVVGEGLGDRPDQVPDKRPVEVYAFPAHIGARARPVLKRNGIAEDDTHVFKNVHRRRIDPVDLLGIHGCADRQVPLERGQHRHVPPASQRPARPAPAGPAHTHPSFAHPRHSVDRNGWMIPFFACPGQSGMRSKSPESDVGTGRSAS